MLPSIWNYCQICNSPFFIWFVFKAVSFFFYGSTLLGISYLPPYICTVLLLGLSSFLSSFAPCLVRACVLCSISIFLSVMLYHSPLSLSGYSFGKGTCNILFLCYECSISESVNAFFGGKGFFLF